MSSKTLVGYQWMVGRPCLSFFISPRNTTRSFFRTITVDYKAL